jgi:hypothetical protein
MCPTSGRSTIFTSLKEPRGSNNDACGRDPVWYIVTRGDPNLSAWSEDIQPTSSSWSAKTNSTDGVDRAGSDGARGGVVFGGDVTPENEAEDEPSCFLLNAEAIVPANAESERKKMETAAELATRILTTIWNRNFSADERPVASIVQRLVLARRAEVGG